MSYRESVLSGEHDSMLLDNLSSTRTREALDDDPWFSAEAKAMEEAVLAGKMDPAAFFEAVLTGPGSAVANIGTSQVQGIAAEDQGWIRGGDSGGAAGQVFAVGGREQMVRYLFWLYGHNPLCKNIINNYTYFTIGEGFRIAWKGDFRAKKRRQKEWRQIAREQKWRKRVKKLIRHTYLLGEWFSVFFPLSQKITVNNGALEASSQLERDPDQPQLMRGLGPDQISKIITRGDPTFDKTRTPDAEHVLAYLRSDEKNALGPGDVIHHRYEELGNLTRGISIMFPVLRYIRYWEKWVENRHWLNFARARIPLIRKVRGGAGAVAGQKTTFKNLPPPATVIVENLAAEWVFPELKLDAGDARHDGRALLLAIAAGVSLPEFMVTGDASNSNYSASYASESPMVKMFETLQSEVFIPDLTEMVAMLSGVDPDDFEVQAGAVIRRSLKTIVEPLRDLLDRGVISKESAATKAGFDWEVERERIQAERQEDDGFGRDPDDEDETPPAKKTGRPERDGAPGDDGQGGRRPRPGET